MKKHKNTLKISLILVVLFALFPVRLLGQDGSRIIRHIRVEGNKVVLDGEILSSTQSREGSVFDEKLISKDVRAIMIMPQIYDVRWRVEPAGDKVDIIYIVTESSLIREVTILGNKHIETDKLTKELDFQEGDFLERYMIQQGIGLLGQVYHDKGYYFAQVSLESELLEKEQKVVYVIVEGPRGRIKKLHFKGNDSFSPGKLKGKIKTRSYFPIFRKGLIEDSQLESDRQSLVRFYNEEGYLDARVFVDMRFNEQQTRATVTFVIEEGMQYKIANILFEGNKRFSDQELLEEINLEPGQVLKRKHRVIAQRSVGNAFQREGYIYADVYLDVQYTDQEGQIDVVFKIQENRQYLLGRLIVKGNYQTRDKVIRRDFDRYGFLPGSVYNQESARRAQRRLRGSGLFEDVTVMPIGKEPGYRDALVEVTEARTGMLLFGVGIDTNSGVMGQFSIDQRNFDISRWPGSLGELLRGEAFIGGGQRMKLEFEPGTRVTRGRLKFYEPYLFDQPYYLDLNLFLFRRWRESYLERRRGSVVTIGRRFDNDWSIEGTIRVEVIRVSDLSEGIEDGEVVVNAPQDVIDVEGGNVLTSFKAGVGRNTTDRMFRPSEGYKIHANWEQVGVLGGDFSYAALSAGGTIYYTVYEDITERSTILAAQLRGSKIIGDAPLFEKYYAGGIGTLRGFDYRGVSPRDKKSGDPIGSDYILIAGAELTHPLFEETIFGKLFCDSGLLSDGTYRLVVGFGLELVIAQLFQMVPMQFDFGFPIFSDDEDEEQVFSFNFGMSF